MTVLIREAGAVDCSVLVDLMGQLGYPITQDEMFGQIKLYQNNQAYKIWVAESDGIVVGCVSVALVEYFPWKDRFMRITSLIVDANHRRQGVGKLLMEYAEAFATKHGCCFIELTSGAHRAKIGSHDFYKSLGYQDLYEVEKYLAKKLVAGESRYR